MPLPANGPLSLQGHSKPGDIQHSKPKQAKIVRLTAEILEQLEAFPIPKLQVDFGENPGFYIGDEFYAIKEQQEGSAHELYLRHTLPNRPGAPLKLHADVTAKISFVDRKLGKKTQSAIREKTQAAEKQRTESKIKLLDAPLATITAKPTGAKKRKDAAGARKPSAVDAHHALFAPSAQTSRVASPRPSTSASSSASSDLRQRLLHFVALKTPTKEGVMRGVGGSDASEQTKEQLMNLLLEVASPVPVTKGSSNDTPKYQLKAKSWIEIRPYDWPNLSEVERTNLARQARTFFFAMKIPETDRAWEHIRYREANGAGSSMPAHRTNGVASGSTAEAKRPAISDQRRSRPSEAAGKKKATDIIIAKDEGSRAKAEKVSAAANGAAAQRPPLRRVPGSGFKAKSHTPTPPAADPPSASGSSRPLKKPSAAEPRDNKVEPRPSSSASSSRSLHPLPQPPHEKRPTASTTSSATRVPKRERDTDVASRVAESDRESRRGSPLPAAGTKRRLPREEREPGEREPSIVPKRRKIEESERAVAPARTQARDLTLPKKPVVNESAAMAPPRPKHKKEPSATPSLRASTPVGRSPLSQALSPRPPMRSSLPPKPPANQDRVPSAGSTTSHRSRDESSRNGSAKPRRKSPIYTSSEDESEPKPRVAIKHEEEDDDNTPPTKPAAKQLPEDFAQLSHMYNQMVLDHMALFQRMQIARAKFQRWSDGTDEEYQNGDEDFDPNEADLMHKLNKEYQEQEREMLAIVELYADLAAAERAAQDED